MRTSPHFSAQVYFCSRAKFLLVFRPPSYQTAIPSLNQCKISASTSSSSASAALGSLLSSSSCGLSHSHTSPTKLKIIINHFLFWFRRLDDQLIDRWIIIELSLGFMLALQSNVVWGMGSPRHTLLNRRRLEEDAILSSQKIMRVDLIRIFPSVHNQFNKSPSGQWTYESAALNIPWWPSLIRCWLVTVAGWGWGLVGR